jgi:hypothetical protein
MQMTTLLLVLHAFVVTANHSQQQTAPDFSSPKKTFEVFLKAVKADDLNTAKQCWFISDDNRSGVLDLVVGDLIADHRLTEIIKRKFKDRSSNALRETELFEPDYTTEAINRTLDRLKEADVERCGETAKMRIRWHADDGQPGQEVFFGPGIRPMRFRSVNGAWKLDANWAIGFRHPADYLEPEMWFYHDPRQVALKTRFIAEIENGKLRTVEQIGQTWDANRKALEAEGEAARKKAPHDAVARRFFAAWNTSRRYRLTFYGGYGSLWGIHLWSRRLAEAESAQYRTEKDHVEASADHVERMRDVQSEILRRAAAGHLSVLPYLQTDNYLAEAEVLLAQARAGRGNQSTPLEAAMARLASARVASYWCWEGIDIGHGELMAKPAETRSHSMPLLSDACVWARRQLDADWAIHANHDDRLQAANAYRERISELEKVAKDLVKIEKLPPQTVVEWAYYRANADFLVTMVENEKGNAKKALTDASEKQLRAAKVAFEGLGPADAQVVYEWSVRWEKAALAMARTKAERVAAIEAHLARLTDLHKQTKTLVDNGRLSTYYLWATEYYLADTEIELAEAKMR